MNQIKIIKKSGNKYFYTYKDSHGKLHKKLCRECTTLSEAKAYVNEIYSNTESQYLIKNIAMNMFIEGGEHMERQKQFGINNSSETINQKRCFINYIINAFGDQDIRYLRISDIENYLLSDTRHSGSWKNMYLEVFSAIYSNTLWACSEPVQKPVFQKFMRNSRKADVFSVKEVEWLFDRTCWERYEEYLLFKTIFYCGLRISEARALKVNQIIPSYKVLLVNGFCKSNGFRTNYNKKGSNDNPKHRIVPLPDILFQELLSFITLRNRRADDFIFQYNGKPYRREHLESVFKRVLIKKGFDISGRKLVPHSLRFTYVTVLRREVHAEDVQKIVGHNSVSMTEYYTRFSLLENISALNNSFVAVNNLAKELSKK